MHKYIKPNIYKDFLLCSKLWIQNIPTIHTMIKLLKNVKLISIWIVFYTCLYKKSNPTLIGQVIYNLLYGFQ